MFSRGSRVRPQKYPIFTRVLTGSRVQTPGRGSPLLIVTLIVILNPLPRSPSDQSRPNPASSPRPSPPEEERGPKFRMTSRTDVCFIFDYLWRRNIRL